MKVVLGVEYDDAIRTALMDALARRGARKLWRWRGHGGSQEIEGYWFLIGFRLVRVHIETHVGIAVLGAAYLVASIASDVTTTPDAASN